jgi:hypothetical protein
MPRFQDLIDEDPRVPVAPRPRTQFESVLFPSDDPLLEDTLGKNAEQQRKAVRVADENSISPAVVDDVEAWDKMARAQRLQDSPPAVRSALADPDFGPAVHDEAEKLSGLEWMFGQWQRTGDFPFVEQVQRGAPQAAFAAGEETSKLADIRFREMQGEEVTAEDLAWADVAEETAQTQFGAESWIEKGVVEASRMAPFSLESIAGGAELGIKAGIAAGTTAAVLGPAAPVAAPAATAAAFTTGSVIGAYQTTRKLEGGLAYGEFKKMPGMTPDAARLAAELVGNVNGALEVGGLAVVLRQIPGVRSLIGTGGRAAVRQLLSRKPIRDAFIKAGKSYVKAGAAEVTTEVLQELTTLVAGNVAAGSPEEIATVESLGRLVEVATATAQAMTIMGAAGPAGHIAGGAVRAQEAQSRKTFIDALGESAADSKVREALPERYAKLVDQMQAANGGPVEDVYIPAEEIVELFQDEVGQFLQGLPAEVVDTWDETLAIGGDIKMSVGEFAARIGGTEAFTPLSDHVRWGSPEAMTAAEAREFEANFPEELLAERDRALAEQEGLGQDAAQRIKDDVISRSVAAGRAPAVAEREATIVSEFYRVQGERFGVDPEELYSRRNLRIRGELPEQIERARVDAELDPLIDRLRNRQQGIEPKEEGVGLIQFLKTKGGVQDTGGELKAMDAGKQRPGFVSGKGLDLDAAGLAAQQAGYFAERPTPDQVLEAIREELAGTKQIPLGIQEKRGEREVLVDQLASVLDEMDLDVGTATNEEIKAALEGLTELQQRDPTVVQAEFDRLRADMERLLDEVEELTAKQRDTIRALMRGETVPDELFQAAKEGLDEEAAANLDILRQGPAKPRAAIRFGEETVITLGEKADLSSFLHEGAHLFMRELRDLAALEGAPEQIVKDWETLQGFTADEETQTGKEEKLARAFELYLREGSAPSAALADVFQRLRSWFVAVYRMAKQLNVELTDEVRQVFDRMLATDEEIAAQESTQRYGVSEGLADILSPEELSALQARDRDATEAAIQKLEEQKIRERQREKTAAWKAERAKVQESVEQLINRRPVYQAIRWLSKGEHLVETPEIFPAHRRLDRAWLVDRFGEEILPHMKRIAVPPVFSKEGLDPDIVATFFGYGSGAEMVDDMINATPYRTAVETMTTEQMRERHGDLDVAKEQAATAAMEAVHSDQRALYLHAPAPDVRCGARQRGRAHHSGQTNEGRCGAEPLQHGRAAGRPGDGKGDLGRRLRRGRGAIPAPGAEPLPRPRGCRCAEGNARGRETDQLVQEAIQPGQARPGSTSAGAVDP